MSDGMTPWSKYSNSQPRGNRVIAEQNCHMIFTALRESGDWRLAVTLFVEFAASHPNMSRLWTEAIIREMEVTSLEEIVMKTIMRR